MQSRFHPRTPSVSRPLILVCLTAWVTVLGASLGGVLALSVSELSSFTVASTVVFAALAIAYELGY
ncbi:hypothetical protein [Halorubellus salinus]|uniref:hypothetical protein n=1 Tax=Halorubellus salinus TaxID=755309 RepID=UPI001D081823|nr:hypothetical protein [Halorubellus salinus]